MGCVTDIGEIWLAWQTLEKTGWCDGHLENTGWCDGHSEKTGRGDRHLENSGLCDRHRRIMGCVTDIGESWVVWQTLKNFGLCERHRRILACVNKSRKIWSVWQTWRILSNGEGEGENCDYLVFHYRGTQLNLELNNCGNFLIESIRKPLHYKMELDAQLLR